MADIALENIWSNPKENAHFLDWCTITIQVRNISKKAIHIDSIECLFKTESEEVFSHSTIKPIELVSKELSSPMSIEFEASLLLRSYTNFYKIRVYYQQASSSKVIELDPRKFLIFHPRGTSDKYFFISHKDPEDSETARNIGRLLKKLGFEGYIAEDDRNPGVDLWEEKIPSRIAACLGLIVLWTSVAKEVPSGVVREIVLAKKHGKRIIIAKESGLELPEPACETTEYFTIDKPVATKELVELVRSVEQMDRMGRFLVGDICEKKAETS